MIKTFYDQFKDRIDMHLGTVVIDSKEYDRIIADLCPHESLLMVELSELEKAAMPQKMLDHLECMRDTTRRVDLLYCLRASLQKIHELHQPKFTHGVL